MNTKVVLCTCGDTLNEKIDYNALAQYAGNLEGVKEVGSMVALCTADDKSELIKMLKGHDRLVVSACTRSVCGKPIENAMKEAGLSVDNYALVNGKEQVAEVHNDRAEATTKAKMLLKAAVAKVKNSEPLETMSYERAQEALIIGGGIAGLTAASELADQGFKVHVIERSPAIGGAMPLISKTYPEEDCTMCLRGPRMIELLTKPGITYHVNSAVKGVERTPLGFKVTYEKKSVELDLYPKEKMGQPVEVIPSPSGEYDVVYSDGPTKAALKKVVNSKCGSCTSVYPAGLLSSIEKAGEKIIEVGSVVLATGFQDFDPSGIPKWGYGLDNVITQYQLARLLDPFGPTAGVVARPSDTKPPKKIVMVQCVGSRDLEYMPDCSKYCCMAAIKHASVIKELRDSRAEITILYRDIRASGYGFESLYNNAKNLGVKFVHGDIENVTPQGEGLGIKYTDGMGRTQQLDADLLVLSTGMQPSEGTDELAVLFNVELTESGFYKEIDEKVANIVTRAPGVFIAGTATGPKNIPDSIAQAGAAAYMSTNYLRTYVEKKVNHPEVNEDKCGKCGAKVSPGYDFCLSCGTKFNEVPPTTKSRSSKSTAETELKTREEKKQKQQETTRLQLKVAIILGVIAGIFFLLGYIMNFFPLYIVGFVFLVGLLIFLYITEIM